MGRIDEQFGNAVVGVVGRVGDGEVVLPCSAVVAVSTEFRGDVGQLIEGGASERRFNGSRTAVDGVN